MFEEEFCRVGEGLGYAKCKEAPRSTVKRGNGMQQRKRIL